MWDQEEEKNREKSDTRKVFSKQRKDSLYDNKDNKNSAVFATHFGNKISCGQNVSRRGFPRLRFATLQDFQSVPDALESAIWRHKGFFTRPLLETEKSSSQCTYAARTDRIRNLLRRNPGISLMELYAKLKFPRGYQRHPCSLFRFLRKQSFSQEKRRKKKPCVPKPCDTPKKPGVKWQLDVQYVPSVLCWKHARQVFPIYRHRWGKLGTIPFCISWAIFGFHDRICQNGYQPKIIQTDNGTEFTYFQETKRTHPFDRFCQEIGIKHQLIRPRTLRHNGKVERSHCKDNERFYSRLSFYSYEDLLVQMRRYLYKSTTPHADTPMNVHFYWQYLRADCRWKTKPRDAFHQMQNDTA